MEIAERNGLCQLKMQSMAGDPAGDHFGMLQRMEDKTGGGWFAERANEPEEAAVNATDALEAGDDFLADIAALVEIDGGFLKSCFLNQCFWGELTSPDRQTTLNAQEFDFLRGGFRDAVRWRGAIIAFNAQSGDSEIAIGSRLAEYMNRRIGGELCGDRDIVRDKVFFEACLHVVEEYGLALKEERGGTGPDVNMCAEFALRREEASGPGGSRRDAQDIATQLAIKISGGIGAFEGEEGPLAGAHPAAMHPQLPEAEGGIRGSGHFFPRKMFQTGLDFSAGVSGPAGSTRSDSGSAWPCPGKP